MTNPNAPRIHQSEYSFQDFQQTLDSEFPTKKAFIDFDYSQPEMRLAETFKNDPDFQKAIGRTATTHVPLAQMRGAQILQSEVVTGRTVCGGVSPTKSPGCG